ncbi:hypothetical protein [Zavarzinia aquatilis]|nr:hypothetical protein [Zavarzinia aquatilis]
MALTAPRSSVERSGDLREPPVAANTTIYQGALVCIAASGYAVPGSTATTLKAIGRAERTVVNGATAGAERVQVKRGIFRFKNSTAGDAIALTDVGADCYVVDDETVAKTNGTNTRSVAGKIFDVDAQGVWVDFR